MTNLTVRVELITRDAARRICNKLAEEGYVCNIVWSDESGIRGLIKADISIDDESLRQRIIDMAQGCRIGRG